MGRKTLLEEQKDLEIYKKECENNLLLLYAEFGKMFFACDRDVPAGLETEAENIRNVLELIRNVQTKEIKIREELEKPVVYLCPNCNTQSVPGAKFCHECGTKLELGTEEKEEIRECPNCGNPLKPQTRFCGKCGTPVS